MSKSDRRLLVQAIQRTFQSITLPSENEISIGSSLESLNIAKAFSGKKWSELPVEFLRYNASALVFFTDKAFYYYLPAYLIACITDYKVADIVPLDVIILLFPDEKFKDTFERRIRLFTLEQKRVIREFLLYMDAAHRDDFVKITPHRALHKYWNQFE